MTERYIYNCKYFKKAYKSGLRENQIKTFSKTNEAKVRFYCRPCDHVYTCRILDFYCTTKIVDGKQTRVFKKEPNGCNHCLRLKAFCKRSEKCVVCCTKKGYKNNSSPKYFDKSHPLFHELVDKSLKLTVGSREEPEFKCEFCGLIYTKMIDSINTPQKTACPHHSRKKRFCGVEDCKICKDNLILECTVFKNAYVSGLKKNYKTLTKKNGKEVEFHCETCNHNYICKIKDFYCTKTKKNGKQTIILRDVPGGCNHCTRTSIMCVKECTYCDNKHNRSRI